MTSETAGIAVAAAETGRDNMEDDNNRDIDDDDSGEVRYHCRHQRSMVTSNAAL